MRALSALLLAACCWPALHAQTTPDEPVTMSTDHPRLFLRPQRLRLLRRERDRSSMRWQQFAALITGNAPMPEPGFAKALYYQVAGDQDVGRQAIAWAVGPGTDLRQQALVFDWCQDLLTDPQRRDLTARLQKGMAAAAPKETIAAVRSRTLAAVALFDHAPTAQKELQAIVRTWWDGAMVPQLKAGRSALTRDDAYPLFELLHAVRDNTIIDLREPAPRFFRDYPIEHLLSYYPPPFEGPDTQYYIGAEPKPAEPDLKLAALSRAAELSWVAFDANGPESQVLQGWLMHDKFILKGTFGAPYEFLWANPYQPGLSYYHVPLIYHNPESGTIFVRSSWDDTAKWFGYWDGVAQVFDEGHPSVLDPKKSPPVPMQEALIVFANSAQKFQAKLQEEQAVFVVGLEPHRTYLLEVDDEEMFDEETDAGGILVLDLPHNKPVTVRIRPS